MTVIAGYSDMRAGQLKIGSGIVIEQPQVPGDRVVACLALNAKIASVHIVVEMAAIAIGLRV